MQSRTFGKGSYKWQSVQIAVKRQLMEEIDLGQIKAQGGLSALTYRLLLSMRVEGKFVR